MKNLTKTTIIIAALISLFGCDGQFDSENPVCENQFDEGYDSGYDDAVLDTPTQIIEIEVPADTTEIEKELENLKQRNSDLENVIRGLMNGRQECRESLTRCETDRIDCEMEL